jgi:hypothetical protein
MRIAIAKNHMAEMNVLSMLAVLDKTVADATLAIKSATASSLIS